jgi:acyl-CoA synthetase (AMP-forming)/AMP-acid ligase II
VTGVPHPKWSERPLLIVVLTPGESVSRDDLLALLAAKVPSWWVPDDVIVVPEIPHTGTGKIIKIPLRDKYRDYLGQE